MHRGSRHFCGELTRCCQINHKSITDIDGPMLIETTIYFYQVSQLWFLIILKNTREVRHPIVELNFNYLYFLKRKTSEDTTKPETIVLPELEPCQSSVYKARTFNTCRKVISCLRLIVNCQVLRISFAAIAVLWVQPTKVVDSTEFIKYKERRFSSK